jgi:hypothetical protein
MLKVFPLGIDLRDALDPPPNAEVILLVLPVLSKHSAPDGACETIDGREVTKEEPREGSERGWKDEKGKVGLGKGKVESDLSKSACVNMYGKWSYLLTQAVSNVV